MKQMMKYMSAVLASAALLASCSKDYLNTTPTTSTSPDTAFETVENAAQAINGICELMTTQHSRYSQGFNGEGTIKLMYGEYPGNDFSFPEYAPGWAVFMNMTYFKRIDLKYADYPWYYYYMIIGNANSVIAHIDEAVGEETERQFIKAQALTFRAYAYTMLLQLYSHRWCDSNNGAADGVVLRLDESTDGLELSSMADCYGQIYDDLNEAISLYTQSGLTRESKEFYKPDLSVAYAVYARAALTREDWPKAQEMAPKAYASHPLMSVAEYRSGFCTSNDEWIWGSYGDSSENLWYWAWGVTMGYNGYYTSNAGYHTLANRELIDLFPNSDMRKNLFLHQELFPDFDFMDFYEEDEDGEMTNEGTVDQSMGYVFDKTWDEDATSKGMALGTAMSNYAKSIATYTPGYEYTGYSIYAHLKFAVLGMPGVSNTNHLRSSEMYLIEAEAAYHNNDETTAKNALYKLNHDSGRDPEYVYSTNSGAALLEEIRNYRRLELWGEGFSWFDYKRWKLPVSRKSFAKGGSFNASVAVTVQPEGGNEWTWDIPLRETDYNDKLQ